MPVHNPQSEMNALMQRAWETANLLRKSVGNLMTGQADAHAHALGKVVRELSAEALAHQPTLDRSLVPPAVDFGCPITVHERLDDLLGFCEEVAYSAFMATATAPTTDEEIDRLSEALEEAASNYSYHSHTTEQDVPIAVEDLKISAAENESMRLHSWLEMARYAASLARSVDFDVKLSQALEDVVLLDYVHQPAGVREAVVAAANQAKLLLAVARRRPATTINNNPKPTWTRESIEPRVRRELEMNHEASSRDIAAAIGCRFQLVAQTKAFRMVHAQRAAGRVPKPKTVSLNHLAADVAQPDELEELLRESETENRSDPSPLAPGRRTARIRR